MKTVKYLIVGAALLGMSAPAMAQMDQAGAIKAVQELVASNATDKEKDAQLKGILKPFKKDATVYVAVARAYFDAKNYSKAIDYADQALSKNKKCGDAFVIKGNVAVMEEDGGMASSWFEQAIMAEPTNPEGYRRYAQVNSKVSPAGAVAKLEELRKNVPGYPVDVLAAEIYESNGNLDKAIEYYDKADKNKMEDHSLASYGTDVFLKGDFEKSLSIAKAGEQRFPRNAGLNRLVFFNSTNLKRYDEALAAADKLFNATDNATITEHDYLYLGYANAGAKNYSAAVEAFNKCLENAAEDSSNRLDALKNLADAYQNAGDFNNGVETYAKYLEVKTEKTANDYNTLAQMYVTEAEKYEGEEKVALIQKGDAVYADMVERFPSAADFCTVQRAHMAHSLDPDMTQGLAKPHYEKLLEIVEAKAEKDERDNSRIIEACRYIGAYYVQVEDNAEASLPYWEKILSVDPDNAQAKNVVELLNSTKN